MIIQGFNRNVLPVKVFRPLFEDPRKKAEILVNDRRHLFYYKPEEARLYYEAEDYEGNMRQWFFIPEWKPSNLPGVEADILYLSAVGMKASGKLFRTLYLKFFFDGVFFCSRHQYDHLYDSQAESPEDKPTGRMHRYKDRISSLYEMKKLRLQYKGKPTRTAERLEAYRQKRKEAEYQLAVQIRAFIEGR